MFQPNESTLQQVIDLLEKGRIPDNKQQQLVYQRIEEFSQSAEFYYYLAYILGLKSVNISVRHMAGATLKSQVERNYEQLPAENLEYLKSQLFVNFNDTELVIQRSVSSLMTMLVYKGGFQKWPELLPFMTQNLDSWDTTAILNTIECLSKIVEDLRVNSENFSFLDSSKGGSQLNTLIPKLFSFCDEKFGVNIQAISIHTLNLCVQPMPAALAERVEIYLRILLTNTRNQDAQARLRSFEGMLILAESRPSTIVKAVEQIIPITILGIQDGNKDVAKTACNFIIEYMSDENEDDDYFTRMKSLGPYLKEQLRKCGLANIHYFFFHASLLPQLVKGLQYTDEDIMNILPSTLNVTNSSDITSNADLIDEFGDSGVAEEDGFSIEKPDENSNQLDSCEQTLRKLCARILTKLSQYFRDEVFLICQPHISECFFSTNWKIQELGIICLGDIAEGSENSVEAHLATIIPQLLDVYRKEGQHYLLQSSILWTICQYTNWLVQNAHDLNEVIKSYLQCMAQGITQNMQYLQESACSSLKEFVDLGAMILSPYLKDFLQVISELQKAQQNECTFNEKVITLALKMYTNNDSLIMLLDAVSTLVEQMKEEINNPEVISILVPPIVEKWSQLKLSDPAIKGITSKFTTFFAKECLSTLATELGTSFAPYCEYIYSKCLTIMTTFTQTSKNSKDRKIYNQKKSLFLMASDLMSSMVYCLQEQFPRLAATSNDLQTLIHLTIDSDDCEVRSFTFMLVAEIAARCPDFQVNQALAYAQYLSKNIVLFPNTLDPGDTYLNTCNNAIASLNQFCKSYPDIMRPHAFSLAQKILNKELAQSMCFALGSAALLDLQNVSQLLPNITKKYCLCLRQLPSNSEDKSRAFESLFKMAFINPNGVVSQMNYVVDAFMNYINPSEQLASQFKTLLNEYRSMLSEPQWQTFLLKNGFSQVTIHNIILKYCA